MTLESDWTGLDSTQLVCMHPYWLHCETDNSPLFTSEGTVTILPKCRAMKRCVGDAGEKFNSSFRKSVLVDFIHRPIT